MLLLLPLLVVPDDGSCGLSHLSDADSAVDDHKQQLYYNYQLQ
jgi:hypothetical protein